MPRFRVVVLGLLVLALVAGPAGCAKKATFPERDIVVIVPYKPGGGYDLTARIIAPLIAKYLPKKVNVVVQNVSGAGGKVGTQQLMNSKPDGYTLGIQDPLPLSILAKRSELGSATMKNIVFLARLDASPALLALGTKGKFKSAAEMKGKPVRFGGQIDDTLTVKLLGEAVEAKPTLINYDALAESCLAVARGDADAAMGPAPSVMRQIDALQGKLKAALIIGDKLASLPDVPTAGEIGLKIDEAAFLNSHILIAPPGVPENVRKVLAEAVDKAIHDPEFSAQLTKAGFIPAQLTGADLEKAAAAAASVVDKYESFFPK